MARRPATGPLMAPTGEDIIGTLEVVPGHAELSSPPERLADGSIHYDHAGETEVFWDDQETVTDEGKIVFVDAAGYSWRADQLIHCRAHPQKVANAWAPTTRVDCLLSALRLALPQLEMLTEVEGDGFPNSGARAALAAVRSALGIKEG